MSFKIPQNIVRFAGEDNLGVYKMFDDYYAHYRSLMGDKNATYATTTIDNGKEVTISFDEKEARLNEALKKEIMRVANVSVDDSLPVEAWASNPQLRWATFAVVSAMLDLVMPKAMIDNLGFMAEFRNIGWGDSAEFEIMPRDLFVISKVGPGKRQAELQKQFTGTATVMPEKRQLTVYTSLFKVLAGKESLADFTRKMIASFETQLSYDVYEAFKTAMDTLDTTPSTGLKVAGYTASDFATLASKVSAWNGGAKAIVVGTPVALSKVIPADSNWRYTLDSEYARLGYIRNFMGVDALAIPQIADWRTPFSLRMADNRLWFVSPGTDKPIKVVLEGNAIGYTDNFFDNANLLQTSTLIKSWGTGFVTSAVAGTMTLS